jgi:hypothetical protein
MSLSFSFPQLGQATGGAVATNPDNFNEESLRRVGIEFASNNLPNDHMFSRMGGWNVTFRASITRITFFKLLGLGLAAAFMATSPHVGAFTSWSLTMSAAINLVACYHYNYICSCFHFEPFLLLTCSALSAVMVASAFVAAVSIDVASRSHQSLFPSCPQGTSAHRPTGCLSTTNGWHTWAAPPPRTRHCSRRSRSTTNGLSSFRR